MSTSSDAPETVWSLITAHGRTSPHRPAIVDRRTEVDYGRLLGRARAIAAELAARGVEPGSRVAVCMGRSWELVATLLGVMGAGCAYMPLDPRYPRQRLGAMVDHARVAAAVVDRESSAELCGGVAEILRLEKVGEEGAPADFEGLEGPQPTDLAYVLYTSGSTGQPKGVAVEHRSVVAMSRALGELLDEEDLAGMLASASVSFDASVLEILGTLCLGGTVILAENLLELPELPAAERVRTVTSVPTVLQALLTAAGRLPPGVRSVIFGGEVLKRSLVDQLRRSREASGNGPGPRVINVYGPTEATVFVTAHEVPVGDEAIHLGTPVLGTPVLGTAVPGSRVYVLDEARSPVPPGETGELYLAGDQLARGYLHEEELTRERFLEVEPTATVPETRLYRTGDLGRRREDGALEFLGRVDQQVKVRGFRIELEEIEAVLESMDGVDGAAAAVVDGAAPGQRILVGYVVGGQAAEGPEVTGEAAREYLAERLPGHLVPQVVMRLDALPLLPNGKLDRKALPAPGAVEPGPLPGPTSGPGSAGEGSLAHRLAGLSRPEKQRLLQAIIQGEVASLLRLPGPEQVPPHRSVFDLGVDSLTAAELSSRLAAVLGRQLPITVILERMTPAAVADFLLESGPDPEGRASEGRARGGGSDTLASLQAQVQTCYPPFLAAKARAWCADDKAELVQALKKLVSGLGQDPHSKVVRTGSAHRGVVADVHTRKERDALIWTTNLYLGLNRDPQVIEAAGEALERFGTGMGTSAVAGGVTDLHLEFERGFAELVGKSAACLFPTGYTANLGVVAGLLGEGDVVVMDQLCHASIVDGARLSGAKIRTFQHNDPADLEAVLEVEATPYRTVLVVLEGVYSMGEGTAPVAEITRVAKRHGALVLVDEAHSFGFYGPRGAGLCAAQGVTDQVDFIMTTLSKALGSLGGVIAASEKHITLLRSSARAYIFQASTSPAAIAAAVTALGRLRDDDSLRERLWDTTRYMRRRFTEAGYDLGPGDTPVVTPHFPDKDELFAIVDGLFERGVLTSAVTYPVVEVGKSRLRFICSASHTRADVDRTLEALLEAEREAKAEARGGAGEPRRRGVGRPELEALRAWVERLAAYLRETVASTPRPTPDLAVSVGLRGEGEPLTVVLRGGEVTGPTSAKGAEATLPVCSLGFETPRAASTLIALDLEALLDTLLRGTCTATGQVEPFIWLMGRLADWRGASAAVASGEGVGEAREVGALG